MNPYEMMLAQRYGSAGPMSPIPNQTAVPVMGAGTPEDYMSRARKMFESMSPQAEDPRLAAIMERRQKRIEQQEAELAKEGKRFPWEVLTRIGASMASSRSPFFAPALAQGLAAGTDALTQRRMEAMRRRMMLGEQRDQIDMEDINRAERRRDMARRDTGDLMRTAGSLADMDLAQLRQEEARQRLNPDPVERELKMRELRAEIAYKEARARNEQLDDPRMRGSRGGGGGGEIPKGLQSRHDTALNEYNKLMEIYNENRDTKDEMGNKWSETPKGRDVLARGRAAAARVNRLSAEVARVSGENPGTFIDRGAFNPKRVVRPGAANLQDPLGLRG